MKITITPIVSDISITSAQTVVNAQVGLSTSVLSNYVPLDNTGKVPSSLLPSYIDDVLEYTNLANFPAIGESGIIYIALDTFKTYRWTGSAYIWITSGDYVDLTQAQTVEGSKTWSDKANFSSQIESTLASGTPPFVVSSPTVVANLNVSLLEGNSASAFATAAQGSTADTALQNIVEDTSPELGGNLALNSYGMTEAFSAASGIQSSTKVVTVNQSGTAGYDADLVDVTESAVGSGAKYLIRRLIGGVAKFFVDNSGNGYFAGKVGIGTNDPQRALHIKGGQALRFNNAPTDGFDVIQTNTKSWSWSGLSGGMLFNLQNSAFIIPHGNLGVKTAASAAPINGLTVAANASIGSGYALIVAPSNGLIVEGASGVGVSAPNANAILDVASTTKAFMPPRMTTTQKNAIASPTAGMVVYDATLAKLCVYTTAWETITSA